MKSNIIIKMSSMTQIASTVKSNMLIEYPWLADFYELGEATLQVDSNPDKKHYDVMWVMPATMRGTDVTDYVCYYPKKKAYAQYSKNPADRTVFPGETFNSKYGTMYAAEVKGKIALAIDGYQVVVAE